MPVDVDVIILTKNEEDNIRFAVQSVHGWAANVFVFDSFSSDATVEIAERAGATVLQHPFENYGKQRNAALDELPLTSSWVLFLDADEYVPHELRDEIAQLVEGEPTHAGYYIKRRFYWRGQWVKRGYYPTWILRLFRRGRARCEDRSVNEHLVVDGTTGRLRADFIHEDHKSVARWIERHSTFARREAEELVRGEDRSTVVADPFGSQAQRKRWLRTRVWNRLPPLVRPVLYYGFRTVLCGGVLDGKEAMAYHTLQALWFPLLIDLYYLEMTGNPQGSGSSLGTQSTSPETTDASGAMSSNPEVAPSTRPRSSTIR